MNSTRYSDSEFSTLKSVFAGREDLLVVLRKIFFKRKLSAAEVKMAKESFGTDAAKALIKKTFYPEISDDAKLGQQVDLWMIFNGENQTKEQIDRHMETRDLFIRYVKEGVERIDNPELGVDDSFINFQIDKKDLGGSFIRMYARNHLIGHVEMQLTQIKTLAGDKSETVEQAKKRLEKNSTK